jgi:hypothetical protein
MNWSAFLSFSNFNASRLFVSLILIFSAFDGFSQQSKADSVFIYSELDQIETINTVSDLDPNRAAILSAVLPGLGQAYNNQYWKLPFIYGGGILIGHYIKYNHELYHEFRNSLIAEADGLDNTDNPYADYWGSTALTRNRDSFRRNRDLLILIAGAFYILNIVDAHVAAHLNEFNVNDNLSLKVAPTIQSSPVFSPTLGISLALRVK